METDDSQLGPEVTWRGSRRKGGVLSQVGFAAKENKQVDVNTASLQVRVAQAEGC